MISMTIFIFSSLLLQKKHYVRRRQLGSAGERIEFCEFTEKRLKSVLAVNFDLFFLLICQKIFLLQLKTQTLIGLNESAPSPSAMMAKCEFIMLSSYRLSSSFLNTELHVNSNKSTKPHKTLTCQFESIIQSTNVF